MEHLRARFLPRFLETARQRLERARVLSAPRSREPNKLAMELHALAGEAAMLELGELAQLARTAEAFVTGMAAGEADAEASFQQSLESLAEAVAALDLQKR